MRNRLVMLVLSTWMMGCGGQPSLAVCNGDFNATDEDFTCLQDWPTVQHVRVLNKCGQQSAAEGLLQNPSPGQIFPVGTMVQAMPMEAMVKRRAGFDPPNHDWEYFSLSRGPGGTHITARGKGGVTNKAGSCLDCHVGAAAYDYICADDHGCKPLPVKTRELSLTQNFDPTCLAP